MVLERLHDRPVIPNVHPWQSGDTSHVEQSVEKAGGHLLGTAAGAQLRRALAKKPVVKYVFRKHALDGYLYPGFWAPRAVEAFFDLL